MNPEKAESLSPELQRALQPLLAGIEAVRLRPLRRQSKPISGNDLSA
jgi:hypothetical protein